MGFLGIGGGGPNLSASQATQGQIGGIANTLTGTGNTANAAYNQVNPAANSTALSVANNLLTNPYATANGQQSLIGRAISGNAANAQRAQANADASNAARGMSNSGIAAGTTAGINAAELAGTNSAVNNAANYAVQSQAPREEAAANLLNSTASRNYGEGVGALGQAAGQLGNLSTQQYQDAMAQYQAQQANNGVVGNLIGGLGGAALKAFGGPVGATFASAL